MHQRPQTALARLLLPSLLVSAARAQCEVGQLFAGTDGDSFGQRVAISGDTAVVGVPYADSTAPDAGAAFVFERQADGGWAYSATLVPAGTSFGEQFASSVAIDGERIVAGSRLEGPGSATSGTGAAYVFERAGSAWIETAVLQASDGAPWDLFGGAVALSGDLAAVGAWGDDDAGDWAGSAYIFRREPSGAWIETAKLTASDAAVNDYFGTTIELSGSTVLVGAPNHDGPQDSGAVYAFEDGPSGWTQTFQLRASDAIAGDLFGLSIALDGDYAVIGAPWKNASGADSGAAYVFRRVSAASWTEVAALQASDGAASDQLGLGVAIDGDEILVGGPYAGIANVGAVYRFELLGPGWVQTAKLGPLGAAGTEYFGMAVALDGARALIGAPGDDDRGSLAGSVRAFELPPAQPLVGCPAHVSLADGGTQALQLNAGAEHAGALYLVLGSASGTAPGILFDGSLLPLNLDAYLLFTLTSPNTPPLGSSLGFLGAAGQALTYFHMPPVSSPALAGLTVNHAGVVLPFPALLPLAFVSNPAAVTLVP